MTSEDPASNTADDEKAGVTDSEPTRRKRKGGPKHISPRVGAKSHESAEKDPSRGEETEHDVPRDTEQVGQDEQGSVDTESEPEVETVCGYPVHPAAAAFPRCTDAELQVLTDDINKHGQLNDIVQHQDGSILDGRNRVLACERAGRKPRIIKWDGKRGEEVAYVISQNVKRRHLNESQRGMIASKLAALPSGQHKAGKFAGVPTQAEAAEMMQVSERIVRSARKVRENGPMNVTRLVEAGLITLNAVESVLPGLSAEDKQHIEGMPDDDVEAEVKRLNKESAGSTRRKAATGSQTNKADAATVPTTNTPNNDDADDIHPIGAEAVSRALIRTKIEANTPHRRAFVRAFGCLPLSDAAWACELASYLKQEAETSRTPPIVGN